MNIFSKQYPNFSAYIFGSLLWIIGDVIRTSPGYYANVDSGSERWPTFGGSEKNEVVKE